ncbi:Synchronized import protein 1 [Candida viswanathii]|uniref:Synchronized import protein 1 n=1 Tax=Candida viswanathii TaxID=5486 RepID=A0A367YK87_9ASCO|nr:Synchronized import protein 1 [Candida viswanathii]
MGKHRKNKRNQKARHNPVSNPDHAAEVQSGGKSKILPLLTKLKSAAPNDKSMAIGVINVLAEDQRMREMLLKEDVISVVMETCLNDSSDEIVVEAFGLLRNLAIEEGYDVVRFIWENNIWTTIESALEKINTSFKYLVENGVAKEKDKSKVQLLFDFAENIFALIIMLMTADEEIFDAVFSKIDPILEFILTVIENHVDGKLRVSSGLLNTLLEFVYQLSTESVSFVEKIHSFSWEKVSKFLTSDDAVTPAARIYYNGIYFSLVEIVLQPTDPLQKEQLMREVLTNVSKGITEGGEESVGFDVGCDIIATVCEYLATNESNPEEPAKLTSETLLLVEQIGSGLAEKSELQSASAALNNLQLVLEICK